MRKCSSEFKFLQDPTTDFGVICPWEPKKSKYYLVTTVAPSFLIRSSFLQVTRKTNKSGQSSNFDQIWVRAAELQPLIYVRNWFLLNILRMDGQNLSKFCIHIIIDEIYVCNVFSIFFCKFAMKLRPLIDVRKWFLLNILRIDGWNLIKFCIHIIIDKIYVGIVKRLFFANLQQSNGP